MAYQPSDFGINLNSSYYQNKFPSGQCTEYAYGRALESGSFQQEWMDQFSGDAQEWDNNLNPARVGQEPQEHSLMVWDGDEISGSSVGHVAFVEKINSDGSLVVSEANYENPGEWSSRTIHNYDEGVSFIYGSTVETKDAEPFNDSGKTDLPIFDPEYYLENNPGVENAYGENNHEGAESHWVHFGIEEGRASSPVFDAEFYLSEHEDVANAYGEDNYFGAIQHYLNHGMDEGRQASAQFDPQFYLGENPDIANAYGEENYEGAVAHFLFHGFEEGRAGSEEALA